MQYLNSLFPWSLIDDGYNLIISKQIDSAFSSFDPRGVIEGILGVDGGRVRPVYWLFLWLKYKFLGDNSFPYHLFQIFLLIAVCVIIYKIAFKIFSDRRAAILSPILFALFSPSIENWYRLGPIEPIFTLLIALTFFFIVVKKNIFLSSVFLFLTILSKESNIILVPVFLLLFLLFRTKLYKTLLFVSIFSSGFLLLLLNTFSIKGGYTSYFTISPQRVLDNAPIYFYYLFAGFGIFGLLLGAGLVLYLKKFFTQKKGIILWILVFFSGFISLFVFYFFWKFPLGRYMLPAIFFLSLCLPAGLEILISKKWVKAAVILFFLIFLFDSFKNSYEMISHLWTRDFSNSKLIEYLAKNTPKNQQILTNMDPDGIEWVVEIGEHLDLFYNRKDLKSDFFNPLPLNVKKNDIVLLWSEEEKYNKESVREYFQGKLVKVQTISFSRLVYPHNILGSVKRIFAGRIIGQSGDYLFISREYRWDIYRFDL